VHAYKLADSGADFLVGVDKPRSRGRRRHEDIKKKVFYSADILGNMGGQEKNTYGKKEDKKVVALAVGNKILIHNSTGQLTVNC